MSIWMVEEKEPYWPEWHVLRYIPVTSMTDYDKTRTVECCKIESISKTADFRVVEYVRKEPEEANKMCMSDWISVKDRLPANGAVMVLEDNVEREAWFIERKGIFVSPDGAVGYNPTHWRQK